VDSGWTSPARRPLDAGSAFGPGITCGRDGGTARPAGNGGGAPRPAGNGGGVAKPAGKGGGATTFGGGGTAVPWGRSVALIALEGATGTSPPPSPPGAPRPLCQGRGAGTPGAPVDALVVSFVPGRAGPNVPSLAAGVAFPMPRSGLARLPSGLGSSLSHSLPGLGVAALGRVSLGARAALDAGAASGLERR